MDQTIFDGSESVPVQIRETDKDPVVVDYKRNNLPGPLALLAESALLWLKAWPRWWRSLFWQVIFLALPLGGSAYLVSYSLLLFVKNKALLTTPIIIYFSVAFLLVIVFIERLAHFHLLSILISLKPENNLKQLWRETRSRFWGWLILRWSNLLYIAVYVLIAGGISWSVSLIPDKIFGFIASVLLSIVIISLVFPIIFFMFSSQIYLEEKTRGVDGLFYGWQLTSGVRPSILWRWLFFVLAVVAPIILLTILTIRLVGGFFPETLVGDLSNQSISVVVIKGLMPFWIVVLIATFIHWLISSFSGVFRSTIYQYLKKTKSDRMVVYEQTRFSTRLFSYIGIVVILLIVPIGVIVWQSKPVWSSWRQIVTLLTTEPQALSQPQTILEQAESLKRSEATINYNDSQYNFSLSYPGNWQQVNRFGELWNENNVLSQFAQITNIINDRGDLVFQVLIYDSMLETKILETILTTDSLIDRRNLSNGIQDSNSPANLSRTINDLNGRSYIRYWVTKDFVYFIKRLDRSLNSADKIINNKIWDSFSLNSTAGELQMPIKWKSLDFDRDGLSYDEEIRWRTDPWKADTDNDGYSDKYEVDRGFNPLGSGKLK